jgi:hypothetical protein
MPPLPHPLGPVAMETSLVSPVLQREPNLDSMVAIFEIRVLLSQLYIVKFRLHLTANVYACKLPVLSCLRILVNFTIIGS